jgi:MarR family transcriptional regulator, 2-MHQ and catechol-resistance regulon repressor
VKFVTPRHHTTGEDRQNQRRGRVGVIPFWFAPVALPKVRWRSASEKALESLAYFSCQRLCRCLHRYQYYRYQDIAAILSADVDPLMKKRPRDATHVWLVLMKAFHAIGKYSAASIEHTGLGDSDFRVLEVLLHKGPLPVNTIGPKVNLNPGSISVAVDRLYKKGLVSRVEGSDDRRVRIVALTPAGRKLIVPVFQKHVLDIGEAFADLSANELQQLENSLKKVGKRAVALQRGDSPQRHKGHDRG